MNSAGSLRFFSGKSLPGWAMAWPALSWWLVFFVAPLIWIVIYSFGTKPPPEVGGFVSLSELTLNNYSMALSDTFVRIFINTIKTAALGTILCALVGFPVAYTLSYLVPSRWRSLLVFLLILPYWTSLLLRIFAWRIILAPQGDLSHLLQGLEVLSRPLAFLDTSSAVLLGIVYNFLPVLILPMYVALERIDQSLVQASGDLGASPISSFLHVTVPLASSGIAGGMLLTFILAAGDYVVPTILGGSKGLMVGNLVATQILSAQNLPLGSAMAVLLILSLTGTVLLAGLFIFLVSACIKSWRGNAI